MTKIAVIKTGGKQYKVKEGQSIKIEKIDLAVEKKVKFETLLIADGDNVELGKPSLGEKVEAKVIDQGRSDKVMVVKYKRKTRYKKTQGHRQAYTKVEISKIS
jgi:large subunit ribosomal protein L21